MAIDKELMDSKINKIKDPIQKVMLQDILLDVFTQLVEYNDSCFQALEEKINKEEKETFASYFVYTGVCKRENYDIASRFWFEMLTEYTMREEHRLETIFLACDYDTIRSFLNQTYKAKVVMNDKKEVISVRFTYSKKYLDKIEWLYKQFGKNGKRWQTINCPFLYKFLDIIDIEHKIPIDAPIDKIELELGTLGDFIMDDMMLVWNVEETIFETEAIKTAGEKVIQYEHEINKCNQEDGYLFVMDDAECFFTIRTEEAIIVRTEKRPYEEMNCLHFIPYRKEKDIMTLTYPLQTNKRRGLFTDRWIENKGVFAATLGEMKRILGMYPVQKTEGIELVRVEIKPVKELKKEMEEVKSFIQLDYNFFLHSHQLWNKEMAAVLYFRLKSKGTLFTKESIGFLLSELQLYMMEYQCIGIICE